MTRTKNNRGVVLGIFSLAGGLVLSACQPLNMVGAMVTPSTYYRITMDLVIDGKELTFTDAWRCGPHDVDAYVFNAGPPLSVNAKHEADELVWIIENRKAVAVASPSCDGDATVTSNYQPQIRLTDDYKNRTCYEIFRPSSIPDTSPSGRIRLVTGTIEKISAAQFGNSSRPYNAALERDLDYFRYWVAKPPQCPEVKSGASPDKNLDAIAIKSGAPL